MQNIVVTEEGVRKLLAGLNTSKSSGPDDLHPRVLKEVSSQIAPILAHIFQKSLNCGDLPRDWCVANICPIYKKGDRSLPINYRPISLTSIICKTLEHIVCSNIMNHLEKHDILTDRQHAFRRSRSCVTQLGHVVNDWAMAMDNGLQTDAFVLDFAKAFDSVPHERLKAKLNSYGICDKTLNWIDGFLCKRYQRVVVNGTKSNWTRVSSGVPQGTVLGPILFNLFINDITEGVSSDIRLFADDCICYRTIRTPEDCKILQRDISHLASWAKKWYMDFAHSKCKMMRISRKTRHNISHLYQLQDLPLESVDEIRYLGVTISSDLRWNSHVANVVNRANRILGLLRRNLTFCNPKVKETAYIGLVRPLLEYASVIWDPHTRNLQCELEKVQRRAVRFVKSDYFNFKPGTITNYLDELKWQTLKQRRDVSTIILFNQSLNSVSNLPLDSVNSPLRPTRHMHTKHFIPLYARTDVYKYSLIPRAIRLWNNIPQEIIDLSTNLYSFEKAVRDM